MQKYQYGINPQYTSELKNKELTATTRSKLSQPTAFWVDSISAIDGTNAPSGTLGIIPGMAVQRKPGNNLVAFLDSAVKQSANANKPVTVVFIVYDLPGRDCDANSSNGEIAANNDGLATYKNKYIDKLYNTLNNIKYKNLNLVAIIEPDSIPNLVTNATKARCPTNSQFYIPGITYALNKLGTLNNITFYLDAAHGGWLGWKNNVSDYVKKICDNLFPTINQDIKKKIRGFATNTSNYQPLGVDKSGPASINPCKPSNSTVTCGGPDPCGLKSQWNFGPNEINYIQLLDDTIKQNDACGNQEFHYITDTGRNGDPTVRSTPEDCANWCNIRGKIGLTPTDQTAMEKIDAYYWLKPPGESDGCAPSSDCTRSDSMCSVNKTYQFSKAPPAGVFSPDIANYLARQN
jgi:cellulose 1,4-beta-cellobiosidase